MIVLPRSRRIALLLSAGLLAIGIIPWLGSRPARAFSTEHATEETSGALAQQPAAETNSAQASAVRARGAEIVLHGGYPELRVAGQPFFMHSAAFFYYRVPADLWEVSLERYRSLGINTIDISIPWNWHELKEGELDFDGHSNPRRDLRRLLKLIAARNLKLIARPGPMIANEWRYGGYPGWLLEREDFQAALPAEYRMSSLDLIEGRYPPLAELGARDADAAAQVRLANPVYMEHVQKWLAAVGRELAPFGEQGATAAASQTGGAATSAKTSAPANPNLPLLFVQLDGEIGMTGANGGDAMWRYLESLREALRSAGITAPVLLNSTGARAEAEAASRPEPVGVMGHWFMRPGAESELKAPPLSAEDVSAIEFRAEFLGTQAKFPAALVEYQAGWYAPADDDRPEQNEAENTLDSSRIFLANGLHGISYFPLQDSVTPAGWSAPGANPDFLWNAALDPNGRSRRLADAVSRNGEILMRWGSQLAAAHKRADFGIALAIGAGASDSLNDAEIERVAEGAQKIERLAQLGHMSSELLDPETQSVEQLLRDPVILLPVFDRAAAAAGDSAERATLPISEKSQQVLVEYVRRGGTLVIFPMRPAGDALAEIWKEAPAASGAPSEIVAADWRFGDGRVIESSKNFFSWIDLKQSYGKNREQEIFTWAVRALREILARAGVHPAVIVQGNPEQASSLVLSELVSNEGTGVLGARTSGYGWLSATNLSDEDAADAALTLAAPWASSTGESPERITLEISVPPRESLLLPLGIALCLDATPAANCSDKVLAAGAELVSAAREGKTLELTFYAAARAEIRLRLEQAPSHAEVEDSTPETKWTVERRELSISISRGASPGFLRNIKVQLPYVPHVQEVKKESDRGHGWSELSVVNAVRLPLGPTTYLGSSPPLVVVDDPRNARVTLEATNSDRDYKGDIDVNFAGAYKGTANLRILAGQIGVDTAKLKPVGPKDADHDAAEPDKNGLLHGGLEAREGHDRRRSPIFYVPLKADGVTAYRYDFDGDGEPEWVLENSAVRLIVSPVSGGRALALVDKGTGFDLLSSVGGLRDAFSSTASGGDNSAPSARDGQLFSRAYAAEWTPDDKNTLMRLHYDASDVPRYGAAIEKKVELIGDAVTVSYRVSLNAAGAAVTAAAGADAELTQEFIASQSVAAIDEPGRLTKFCWSALAPTEPADAGKNSAAAAAEKKAEECRDFAPGGAAIAVPAEARYLEVRTPGRPGLGLDWDSGRLTIEPKRYSALLALRSAPLKPGDEARATLHLRVLAPE